MKPHKAKKNTRQKASRGAVRTQREAPKKGLPVIRSVLLLSFLCVTVWGASKVPWQSVIKVAKSATHRPIQNVEIQGDFQFIARSTIETLVQTSRENDFVKVNLRELKTSIEEVPWVEAASVTRVWPDGLLVKVKEQKPIARWGREGFINHYGEIVKTEQIEELANLPVLYGNESLSREITETYIEVAELLATNGVNLRGLQQDDRRAWTLALNEGVELVMGKEDVIQKLRNFLYVYKLKLQHHEHEIEKIDLRYKSGLAVSWKTPRESLANSQTDKLLVKVN